MVKAWFLSKDFGKKDEVNFCEEELEIASLDDLTKLGIHYYQVPVGDRKSLQKLLNTNGYEIRDVVTISRDKLPNYDEMTQRYYSEHLHPNEEIRYIIDGCGYFDVRNKDERWIRMLGEPGDLLVLPAGIYHRFRVTVDDWIQLMRLFRGGTVWSAHDRNEATEQMEPRREYVQKYIAAH
uniref:Acireductone dioxygenase n=1 Tax=Acrobeloides nanus TaxID=290746 RepID=A0A914BVM4_9BILA